MYFLPPAREYLRQIDTLADDEAIAAWSADKREKQALRVKVPPFLSTSLYTR